MCTYMLWNRHLLQLIVHKEKHSMAELSIFLKKGLLVPWTDLQVNLSDHCLHLMPDSLHMFFTNSPCMSGLSCIWIQRSAARLAVWCTGRPRSSCCCWFASQKVCMEAEQLLCSSLGVGSHHFAMLWCAKCTVLGVGEFLKKGRHAFGRLQHLQNDTSEG